MRERVGVGLGLEWGSRLLAGVAGLESMGEGEGAIVGDGVGGCWSWRSMKVDQMELEWQKRLECVVWIPGNKMVKIGKGR